MPWRPPPDHYYYCPGPRSEMARADCWLLPCFRAPSLACGCVLCVLCVCGGLVRRSTPNGKSRKQARLTAALCVSLRGGGKRRRDRIRQDRDGTNSPPHTVEGGGLCGRGSVVHLHRSKAKWFTPLAPFFFLAAPPNRHRNNLPHRPHPMCSLILLTQFSRDFFPYTCHVYPYTGRFTDQRGPRPVLLAR